MTRYTLEDENISHSKFGVVLNEEYLLRVIYEPEHVQNGGVINTAIPLEDLKERGFSLDRKRYVENTTIQRRIIAQTERNPEQRQLNFTVEFQCSHVREILDDAEERAFIVIDDANVDNEAHASLYSAKKNLSKSALRKLREQLLPLLQQSLQIS